MYNRKNFTPNAPKTMSGRVTVTADECGGNADKMVRRFIKKVKNEKIVDECRDRTAYKKPSQVRAEKRRQRQRLIEKVNKQNQILFNNKDRVMTKRRTPSRRK